MEKLKGHPDDTVFVVTKRNGTYEVVCYECQHLRMKFSDFERAYQHAIFHATLPPDPALHTESDSPLWDIVGMVAAALALAIFSVTILYF